MYVKQSETLEDVILLFMKMIYSTELFETKPSIHHPVISLNGQT